jgi:hypothetical protein
MEDKVKMIFATIKRRELPIFLKIINKNNPAAFYTVEDARKAKKGITKNKLVLK